MSKYEIYKTYIKGIVLGYSNSLVVQSLSGMGKTENLLKTLQNEYKLVRDEHYYYFNGYATPKAIVGLLQAVNRLAEPRILVLDDFEESLKSMQAVGILRSALWETNGHRQVLWATSRERISFDFKGKIIFLLNKLNLNNPIVQALASRGFYYTMEFSRQEILQMMREKAKVISPEITYHQKMRLIGMIAKVSDDKLNLRLLPQAIALYRLNPQKVEQLITKL